MSRRALASGRVGEEDALQAEEVGRLGVRNPRRPQSADAGGVGQRQLAAGERLAQEVPLERPVGGQRDDGDRRVPQPLGHGGVGQVQHQHVGTPPIRQVREDLAPAVAGADEYVGGIVRGVERPARAGSRARRATARGGVPRRGRAGIAGARATSGVVDSGRNGVSTIVSP